MFILSIVLKVLAYLIAGSICLYVTQFYERDARENGETGIRVGVILLWPLVTVIFIILTVCAAFTRIPDKAYQRTLDWQRKRERKIQEKKALEAAARDKKELRGLDF